MDWLNFFKILGYIALIFGAICTVGVDYLKSKHDATKDALKDKQMTELVDDVKASKKLLEPFNYIANKLYPNLDQKAALDKLKLRLDNVDKEISIGHDKIASLTSELTIEKNTIKSFEVSVYIEFSGKWGKTPYPIWYQNTIPTPYLKWSDKTKKFPDIDFCCSKINFKTLNENTAAFENILSVQTGKNPLGELLNILSNYNIMSFWFPLSQPKNLLDSHIEVNKILIAFSINGSPKEKISIDQKQIIDLSESLSKADESSIISPLLTLDYNLVELLKIKQ
jgi:hypothetical protein